MVIANVNRGRNQRPFAIEDFLPRIARPEKKRRMSTAQMQTNFRSATAGCK